MGKDERDIADEAFAQFVSTRSLEELHRMIAAREYVKAHSPAMSHDTATELDTLKAELDRRS